MQELEERAARDIDGAKRALKALGDRERAYVLAWLVKYFDDSGRMFSPQMTAQRRTVTIDGTDFYLVVVRKRKR